MLPKFNKIKRILRQESHANRAHLQIMRAQGAAMPRIRENLIHINKIDLSKHTGKNVSRSTLYNAITGVSKNVQAQEILAELLGLKRDEIFTD